MRCTVVSDVSRYLGSSCLSTEPARIASCDDVDISLDRSEGFRGSYGIADNAEEAGHACFSETHPICLGTEIR